MNISRLYHWGKILKKSTSFTYKKPFAADIILYLSKVLSGLSLTLNTHLQPIVVLAVETSTNSQVLLESKVSSSTCIALNHYEILSVSLKDRGLGRIETP